MKGSHEIGALTFRRSVQTAAASRTGSTYLTVFVVLQLFLHFTNSFLWEIFGAWTIAVLVVFYLVVIAVLVVVDHIRNPPPIIDFDAGVMRIGSESTPFGESTEASLASVATKKRDDLYLWFGGHKRRHAMVALRAPRGALSARDREILAAMVERSDIHLPETKFDRYDPTGKFAWLDQQGYSSKDDVLKALAD
jgi:hypothetical protein